MIEKVSKKTKIYLLSDTHLIADSLHDDGAAFQKMKDTSAGKDFEYQEIMLTAFVRKILKDKPDAVVITGDLTFNGARQSAERLAEIFKPLEEVVIKFLPLPGNHDINDGWARLFQRDMQYRTEQVDPEMWQKIFSRSYDEASNVDPNSLSYSVVLDNKYRLILADSNLYSETFSKSAPVTNGKLTSSQLKWIEDELKLARDLNQHVLFFMHHNLYDHNEVVNGSFTLDNAHELQALLAKYDVKATFTGHIHAQNIVADRGGCPSFDVASSCFATCDQGYGVILLTEEELDYQRYSFDAEDFLTEKEKMVLPAGNFHDYLREIFCRVNDLQMARYRKNFDSEKEWQQVIELIDTANWNYFVGRSNYSASEVKRIKAGSDYQLLVEKLPEMAAYVDSLIKPGQNSQQISVKW